MPSQALMLPELLKSSIAANQVVPFLGAGISRSAGLPDWRSLLRMIVEWAKDSGIHLENSNPILKAIEKDQLEEAAHWLSVKLGDKLVDALRTILDPPGLTPTPVHQLLASVHWPAIITTNFDNLIPKSHGESTVLTWQDQGAIGDAIRSGDPHVMMAHGWIDHPETIVLTPREYRESMRQPAMQTYMNIMLGRYSMLFLGYSLRDHDLRYFLEELQIAFGQSRIPHFALLPNSQADELRILHLKDNYGIEVINYTPTDSHPEVETFTRLVIDQVPQQFLSDPLARVEQLAKLRASRNSMNSDEYIKRFRETCIFLAKSGFLQTAWTALKTELHSLDASIATSEKIETTIQLMEMMIEDHAVEHAISLLNDLSKAVANPDISGSLRLRADQVSFRLCLDGYALTEARNILKRARQVNGSHPDVEAMAADLAVGEFLNTGEMDLRRVSNNTFEIGAQAEALAMRGRLDEALGKLAERANTIEIESPTEAVWLRVKRAELLYLAGRLEDAYAEFGTVKSLKASLPLTELTALERNQSFIGTWLGKESSFSTFNAAVDQEPVSKQSSAHLKELLSAEMASRERKHYDSLPPLWRELMRTYRIGIWGGRIRAYHRLAEETLAASWLPQATHHMISGDNKSCGESLAQDLIRWRKPEYVETVLTYLLKNCFLTRHINPAADVLGKLADIIPDNRISAVLEWIARLIGQPPNKEVEQSMIAVCQASQKLAYRWSQEELRRVMHTARTSPFLRMKGWGREALVKAMTRHVHFLADYDWCSLARETLPLATTERWDGDYKNVLDLLHTIAVKDKSAKDLISQTLFPKDRTTIDLGIGSLGVDLGRKVEPDALKQLLARIATRLPLQVWKGTGAAPPFELSFLMTLAAKQADESIRVVLNGGTTELNFVAAIKEGISAADFAPIIEAVLELIRNPLNLRANRIDLMNFLCEIREHLSPEQAQAALESLHGLADGSGPISPIEPTNPSTTDRFQLTLSLPEDQQGAALRAIIEITAHFPQYHRSEYENLLKNALLHSEPILRRFGCYSVTILHKPTEELGFFLITATQDRDIQVSMAALAGVTHLFKNGNLRNHIGLLIVTAERCSFSEHAAIRRLAVRLASTLFPEVTTPGQQAVLSKIMSRAQSDLHFSVRMASAI